MKKLTLLSVLLCASINTSYASTANNTGVSATTCTKSSDSLKREYAQPVIRLTPVEQNNSNDGQGNGNTKSLDEGKKSGLPETILI